MTKDTDMTVGNPFVLIGTFSFSLVIGSLFQQLYTFADTIIIGKKLLQNIKKNMHCFVYYIDHNIFPDFRRNIEGAWHKS